MGAGPLGGFGLFGPLGGFGLFGPLGGFGLSGPLGGFFGGAQGVVENAMFDADIAMALSAALVLERPPSLLPGRWRDGDAIVALYGLSTLVGIAFNAPTVWRHLTQL